MKLSTSVILQLIVVLLGAAVTYYLSDLSNVFVYIFIIIIAKLFYRHHKK